MSWERIHFLTSDNNIFSFFIIYGEFKDDINISASKYNFSEVPENTEIILLYVGAPQEYLANII